MIALKSAPASDAGPPVRPWHWRYPLAISLTVLLLGLWGSWSTWHYEVGDAELRLQTIAQLKHRQLVDWLEERHVDMRNVQSSPALELWRDATPDERDKADRRALGRLESFRANGHYLAVWVTDGAGQRVLAAGDAPAKTDQMPPTRVTEMSVGSPYRDEFGHVGVDFLALLPGTEGRVRVAMRVDVEHYLYPTLYNWPVPSESSEAMLMAATPGHGQMLSRPRFAPELVLQHGSQHGDHLLSARLARADLPQGEVVTGVDYRGHEVLGMGQRVEGTDWLLVTKVDRAELVREALHPVLEVMLACLLTLGLIWAVWALMRHHQRSLQAQALRERQEARLELLDLLEAVLENSTDAIFAKDLQGRYTLMNSAAARFVSRPPQEVIGLTDAELVDPALAREFQEQDETVLRTATPLSYEMTLPESEGRASIWVNKAPLKNSAGQLIGVFGIVRDVTERKADEDRLRSSEERFRVLFDQASVAMLILESDTGRVVEANQRALEQFGYESISTWNERRRSVPSADEETFRAHLARAVSDGPQRFEWLAKRGSGATLWLDVHLRVMQIGGMTRILATGVDIDDRKRAEQELSKRSLALAQSPASVMITDLQGHIEWVNETFSKVSGYSAAEVVGQQPSLLRSTQTPRAVYDALWRALRRGEPWRGEFVNRRKDGTHYVDLAAIHPLRQPNGEITHYVAVQQDVTEERALQEELVRHRHHLEEIVVKRTAELAEAKRLAEEASQAKSAFVANMSHEIRTPMNAVIGLNHLVERDLARQGREEDRPLLERVRKIDAAARHLLGILNDVLDLSKIEAGKLQLEVKEFDLHELCANAIALLQERAEGQDTVLALDIQGVRRFWRGDGMRLGQVLLNLLSNGVKFTHQGRVWLTVREQALSPERALLHFEIRDTGIGMTEPQRQRLFKPFEQAGSDVSRRFGGTGLGLAIVRRLTDLMGGEVSVQSEPGVGSTFTLSVTLDVVEADGKPASGAPLASQSLVQALRQRGGADVLVVEDGAINREIVLDLLSEAGLQADVAVDGRQGLEMARRKAYELILMDLRMPVMDGFEATREIRKLPAHRGTPVVALTAQAFDEDRMAALESGINDHLSKPILPEALYGALLHWLGPTRSAPAVAAAAPPPEVAPSVLTPEGLPAMPGVDWRVGLRTLGGKPARLVQLLGRFANEHGEAAELLKAQLAGGDLESAVRLAHTLKGTGASLGLVDVSAAAAALEQALKTASGGASSIEPQWQALADALRVVTQPLKDLAQASAMPARVSSG